MEEADTVDIDDRASQWRSSGWDYTPGTNGAAGLGTTPGAYERDPVNQVQQPYDASVAAMTGDHGDEQSIPIIEEELIVGKRDVDRGSARVRSYVTEVPVHEQVRLRDERISVQRRAVDRPVTDADDAFRERTIDVAAKGEEAVVSKTARVVEEALVSKTSSTQCREHQRHSASHRSRN